MAEQVSWEMRDRLAVVTIDSPPVNALGQAVREGLMQAFEDIARSYGADAVVIEAAGRTWPVGADVREFGADAGGPALRDVCAAVEECPLPVVAALHGTALGGGFELALGAHYRVAAANAVVGFPEIKLGLLPGAGGTQRMPRLSGAGAALETMLTGRQMGMAEAEGLGLIDAVADGNLSAGARAFAANLKVTGKGVRRVRDARRGLREPVRFMAEVAAARGDGGGRLLAPALIAECVEAALLLPFEAGIAMEADAFARCLARPESRALIHVFLSERQVSKGLQGPATARRLALAGETDRAASLTMALLNAGHEVTVIGADGGARISAWVGAQIGAAVERRRLAPGAAERLLGRLVSTADIGAAAAAEIVIEAGEAGARASRDRLLSLRAAAPAAAAVVTGFFADIDGLSEAVGEGGAVGLGFAAPALGAKLVEVRRSEATSTGTLEAAVGLAKSLGKRIVPAGAQSWGLGPRMVMALREAALVLAQSGVSEVRMVAALEQWGWSAARLLADVGAGPRQRQMADEEVVARLLGALVNTAAALIDRGTAPDAAAVDVVMVLAYDFPRWRGGPVHWAEAEGLAVVRQRLLHWAEDDPFWSPHPLIAEALKTNRGFKGLSQHQ